MRDRVLCAVSGLSGIAGAAGLCGFIAFGVLGAGQIALPCAVFGAGALIVCLIATLASDGVDGLKASDEELLDMEEHWADSDRRYYMGDDMSGEEFEDWLGDERRRNVD